MKTIENQDSFSIGTNSQGGSIKVYFEDIHSETAIKKIDQAIRLWKNAKAIAGGNTRKNKLKFPGENQ